MRRTQTGFFGVVAATISSFGSLGCRCNSAVIESKSGHPFRATCFHHHPTSTVATRILPPHDNCRITTVTLHNHRATVKVPLTTAITFTADFFPNDIFRWMPPPHLCRCISRNQPPKFQPCPTASSCHRTNTLRSETPLRARGRCTLSLCD